MHVSYENNFKFRYSGLNIFTLKPSNLCVQLQLVDFVKPRKHTKRAPQEQQYGSTATMLCSTCRKTTAEITGYYCSIALYTIDLTRSLTIEQLG